MMDRVEAKRTGRDGAPGSLDVRDDRLQRMVCQLCVYEVAGVPSLRPSSNGCLDSNIPSSDALETKPRGKPIVQLAVSTCQGSTYTNARQFTT